MIEDRPVVTITTLGATASGRTTGLLGAYATLSAPEGDFRVVAAEAAVDEALCRGWRSLVGSGRLPADDAVPGSLELHLLAGTVPVLGIDRVDHQVLPDDADPLSAGPEGLSDGLSERLVASDSVHVVLDGRFLVDAVTGGTRRSILRHSGLARLVPVLADAWSERAARRLPRPSVVVQVTKSDLIPPWRRPTVDPLVQDVRMLLEVCFDEGLDTAVCPGSVGRLGLQPGSRVDPEVLRPRGLHLPMLYALAHFVEQWSGPPTALPAGLRDAAGCRPGTRPADRPHSRTPRAWFADLDQVPRFRDGVPLPP